MEESEGCGDIHDAENCKENDVQFQEIGHQLCEEIGALTTRIAEGGNASDSFSSNVYLEQLKSFDESFIETQSCSHMMMDARLTKYVSKLVLVEVRNVHKDAADKTVDMQSFVHILRNFLRKECGLVDEDAEVSTVNQQAAWAAFGDRFMDILRLPPSMSCLGPLLTFEAPKESLIQIKKKAERTKLKKSGEIVKLQEVEEAELLKRTDPLAKQLDNVLHCLKKYLRQRGTNSVNYFEFCFHPTDFSRAVANAFYISFLVKENKVALDVDDDNMPRLSLVQSTEQVQRNASNLQGRHACISFTYENWEEVVKLLNITTSIVTDI